jgi:hypothetical protein
MPASTEHRNLHADLPTTSNGAHPSPSAVALKAAKQFAVYIEFFRTHGTGDLVRKYGEDECMAGYGMVVQRALIDPQDNLRDRGAGAVQRQPLRDALDAVAALRERHGHRQPSRRAHELGAKSSSR